MNASEPLIYYNPIVGEPCKRGDGCSSISVHASQKSSNYGGSASGAAGHLDVCLPGRVTVERPSSQPSTPLGFGPCGSRLQSQQLGSTSLVWWCNDEALITSNDTGGQLQICNWPAEDRRFESLDFSTESL